jgi:hypothetical protein
MPTIMFVLGNSGLRGMLLLLWIGSRRSHWIISLGFEGLMRENRGDFFHLLLRFLEQAQRLLMRIDVF